jgi:hypothetical protein
MIRDLDETFAKFLKDYAPAGSLLRNDADISFELPDANWRGSLTRITVNCYLYDIHENVAMRTQQPVVVQRTRAADNKLMVDTIRPPARIDCAYCITAWSTATTEPAREEHQLLSDVLLVLLRYPKIPAAALVGSMANQIPPYPTVIASQDGTAKTHPEFWHALDQKLKPSLNYVVTLAMQLDNLPDEPSTYLVGDINPGGVPEPNLNITTDQDVRS